MNTPTPWRHEMREIAEFGGAFPCIMSGDTIVAIVLDQEVPDSAAAEQANANLIVDAVNVISNDALRKAREALAFAMIHNGCNNKLFREALDGIGGDSTALPSPIES